MKKEATKEVKGETTEKTKDITVTLGACGALTFGTRALMLGKRLAETRGSLTLETRFLILRSGWVGKKGEFTSGRVGTSSQSIGSSSWKDSIFLQSETKNSQTGLKSVIFSPNERIRKSPKLNSKS
ncbi:hypothetical protein NPIL_571541 [Nephila pilipes]|uniref:Uncharacterized protein n=1 Tax=Nephila pilipes TaxID=299642 RepID=A0A8X6PHU9_NEPPI|nr:hypothetical protein NPIL_571541 [Nephila pilipes]